MRSLRLMLVPLVLLLGVSSDRALAQDSSARSVLTRLECAYEGRDVASYAACFTADFWFEFGDPELAAEYGTSWRRADEVQTAEHLFQGFVNKHGVPMPAATQIDLSLDPLEFGPDPEHPDDGEHYVLAVARSVWLEIKFRAAPSFTAHGRHVFWLVRGDRAVLDRGEIADPTRWYVRRWQENPAMVPIALQAPAPLEPGVQAPAMADREPRILPNPVMPGSAARLECTVPMEGLALDITLYDVAGRRIERLHDGPAHAGRWAFALGRTGEDGRRLSSGIYFADVRIGARSHIVRFVRLAD